MPLFKSAAPEMRRYSVRVLVLMACYGAALVAANRWVPLAGTPALKLVFALLPALPIIGVFFAVARLLVEMRDEYLRMLQVRQILIATGFALSVATAWGFAEDFGVVRHFPGYYVAILWFAGLGLGGCVNRVLEGSGGAA